MEITTHQENFKQLIVVRCVILYKDDYFLKVCVSSKWGLTLFIRFQSNTRQLTKIQRGRAVRAWTARASVSRNQESVFWCWFRYKWNPWESLLLYFTGKVVQLQQSVLHSVIYSFTVVSPWFWFTQLRSGWLWRAIFLMVNDMMVKLNIIHIII